MRFSKTLYFERRMVKISDPLMSKKYGHRTPPGLGFFRKGNYLKFDGKLEICLEIICRSCLNFLYKQWPIKI